MDIKNNSVETFLPVLMKDLYFIINSAKTNVAYTANQELTLMHWRMGERINREVLGNERAAYGKQIVAQVARQLKADLGTKGFDEKSLRRMMQFASEFTEEKIVAQLARQLSWSHFVEVLPIKDSLAREFYLTLSASHRWSQYKNYFYSI